VIQELLRRLALFQGLEEEDLQRLAERARRIELAPGDAIVREGEVAEAAYLILEGTFNVTKRSGEREFVIDWRRTGELIGESALLDNARRTATVRAAGRAEVLEISREAFQEILRKCPDATLTILQTIAGRLHHTELMLRQSEKMATLGTLSAGLAHELNNPAAAVQRAAAQLRDAISALKRSAGELAQQGLSSAQTSVVESLLSQESGRVSQPSALSAVEQADAEEDLQGWLEDLGIDDAWELAPVLAAAGWSGSDLDRHTAEFSPPQRAALIRWLASTGAAYALLGELDTGATRIAEIVSGVKSYAYLDRGPVQLIDVHEGLENTLVILRHKLKQGVEIEREYDLRLPRIEAYGSELNQVWTNLLDNAIDAMNGRGRIRIRTYSDQNKAGDLSAVVEISDDGPGIATESQARIFDAFYTTKDPGKGTGLGLHIAYNIIVNQHRGDIDVESRPGRTTFRVTLPVQTGRS
jgi:signal transduction histidine kinase